MYNLLLTLLLGRDPILLSKSSVQLSFFTLSGMAALDGQYEPLSSLLASALLIGIGEEEDSAVIGRPGSSAADSSEICVSGELVPSNKEVKPL